MGYKVRLYQDNIYIVYHYDEEIEEDVSDYKSNLADCEAWIRLKESGRL